MNFRYYDQKYPQLSADLDIGREHTTRPLCNNVTGGKTDSAMDSWTLIVVHGGGHIDSWQPLYH